MSRPSIDTVRIVVRMGALAAATVFLTIVHPGGDTDANFSVFHDAW